MNKLLLIVLVAVAIGVASGSGWRRGWRKCSSGKCRGDKDIKRNCIGKKCSRPQPLSTQQPDLTQWSSWSTCSKTCGGGSQGRFRESNGRAGDEYRSCNEQACQSNFWGYK